MSYNELICIYGGGSITSNMLNSLVRLANTLLEVGRSLGSAIRRSVTGKCCSL